jgi:isochorismate hydrolase
VLNIEVGNAALGATVPALKQLLPPARSVVYPKTKFSMVLPTGETDEFILKNQIKNVIIIGIESHVCVLQTCLDLLSKNIGVYVIIDAISSCNKEEVPTAVEVRKQAERLIGSCACTAIVQNGSPAFLTLSLHLQRMRLAGATVTTSESVLFELMGE